MRQNCCFLSTFGTILFFETLGLGRGGGRSSASKCFGKLSCILGNGFVYLLAARGTSAPSIVISWSLGECPACFARHVQYCPTSGRQASLFICMREHGRLGYFM
eukprot:4787969-Amphidinium_carterae.1